MPVLPVKGATRSCSHNLNLLMCLLQMQPRHVSLLAPFADKTKEAYRLWLLGNPPRISSLFKHLLCLDMLTRKFQISTSRSSSSSSTATSTTTSASWSSLAWRRRSAPPFASSPWRTRWPSTSLRARRSQRRASQSSAHCSRKANSRWGERAEGGNDGCLVFKCSQTSWRRVEVLTSSINLSCILCLNALYFPLAASPDEPGHPRRLGQNPRQGFGRQELWGGGLRRLQERLCGIL